MNVTSDVMQDRGTRDKRGLKITRVFKVTDVEGEASAKVALALTAYGIPRPTEPHPTIAGIYCETVDIDAIPETTDAFVVVATYVSPDPSRGSESDKWEIETGASTETQQCNFLAEYDENKKRKLLPPIEYTWTEKDGGGPGRVPGVKTQGVGAIDILVPVVTWRCTRRERESPRGRSKRFVGKVNDSNWNGEPPRTWLCTRIDGRSDDGGKTYITTYEFAFKEDTWDVDLVFTDQETGKPPVDADNPKGNGVLRGLKVYFEENFAALQLEGEPPAALGFSA